MDRLFCEIENELEKSGVSAEFLLNKLGDGVTAAAKP